MYRYILSATTTIQRSSDKQSRMPGRTMIDQRRHCIDHAHEALFSSATSVCPNQEELSAAQSHITSGNLRPSSLILPYTSTWLTFHQNNGYWPTIRSSEPIDSDVLTCRKGNQYALPAYSFMNKIDSVLKPRYGHLRVSKPRFGGITPIPICAFYGITHEDRLTVWVTANKSHLDYEPVRGMFDDFIDLLRKVAGLSK